MSGGIYRIINMVNNKFYVGSTKNFEVRLKQHFSSLKNHSHHSIMFQKDYDLYGKDVFKFEIIEEATENYDRDLLYKREQYWIEKLQAKDFGYNIGDSRFGDCISYHPLKQQIKEKTSKTIRANCSKMTKEERKQKWGKNGSLNGMYGKHRTEAEKQHLRECLKGRRSCLKGIPKSEEAKRKMSESRKGKYTGVDNPFYGKHHSEKTKDKLSKINLGKKPTNMRKVVVDNTVFESVAECARHFNVCNATVIFRIKSKHWNWFYYEQDGAIKAPMAV